MNQFDHIILEDESTEESKLIKSLQDNQLILVDNQNNKR